MAPMNTEDRAKPPDDTAMTPRLRAAYDAARLAQKEVREARVEAGLCYQCPRKQKPGHIHCDRHLEKRRKWRRDRYADKGL